MSSRTILNNPKQNKKLINFSWRKWNMYEDIYNSVVLKLKLEDYINRTWSSLIFEDLHSWSVCSFCWIFQMAKKKVLNNEKPR